MAINFEKLRRKSRYFLYILQKMLSIIIVSPIEQHRQRHLTSGFITTGLYPTNVDEVLKKILGGPDENVEKNSEISRYKFGRNVQRNPRSWEEHNKRKSRKKYEAGKQLMAA